MGFKDDFYAVLDAHKEDRGWATSLSQRSGVNQDALSKIINRKTKSPSIDTMAPLIDALGMCLSYGKSVDCSDIAEELAQAKDTLQLQYKEIIGLKANVELLQGILEKSVFPKMDLPCTQSKSCA